MSNARWPSHLWNSPLASSAANIQGRDTKFHYGKLHIDRPELTDAQVDSPGGYPALQQGSVPVGDTGALAPALREITRVPQHILI